MGSVIEATSAQTSGSPIEPLRILLHPRSIGWLYPHLHRHQAGAAVALAFGPLSFGRCHTCAFHVSKSAMDSKAM